MQTSPPGTYKSMIGAAQGILKTEGPLAFYKVSWRARRSQRGPVGVGPVSSLV